MTLSLAEHKPVRLLYMRTALLCGQVFGPDTATEESTKAAYVVGTNTAMQGSKLEIKWLGSLSGWQLAIIALFLCQMGFFNSTQFVAASHPHPRFSLSVSPLYSVILDCF